MRLIYVARVTVAISVACGFLFGKDMVLTTPDGMDIILKDDSTWVFKNGQKGEVEGDFTVPVTGGKIVLIAADGTWGFVKEEIKKEREIIPTDSVIGKGHGVHGDVAVANAMAQKEALAQVVGKMRIALKNVKIDQSKFADCVRRVEKDVDKQEEFKKGTGWVVSIKMTLDRGSILAVAECAMKEEKKPADTVKTTKK